MRRAALLAAAAAAAVAVAVVHASLRRTIAINPRFTLLWSPVSQAHAARSRVRPNRSDRRGEEALTVMTRKELR